MIDKLRSLSKDTLIYGVSTIVGRFLNFILVPFYTNMFLPAEYGVVALLYSYIALLNVFFSAGLESAYMRFASQKEIGTERENFSNPYLLNIANSIFLGVLIYLFSGTISSALGIGPEYAYLVKYSALILFFDSITLIPFASLRLQNEAARFSAIRIVNIVINVLLNFILISYAGMGIEAIFISNIAASAFTFLLVLPVIRSGWTFSFNKQLAGEVLKFAIPYIPTGIAANLVQIIDRPVLKYLSDDATVGIYQANYKLGIFMLLVVAMFEYAWRPFFLNNAKEADAKQIFAKVMTFFVLAGALVVLTVSVIIDDAVKTSIFGFNLIGKSYWSGLSIVPIILLAYLFYGIYINLMAGIYIEKKTAYLPFITAAGAAVNIAGLFVLFPAAGLNGAATATLLSYIVMAALLFIVTRRFYPVQYEYWRLFVIMAALIAMLGLFYLTEAGSLHWSLKLFFPVVFLIIMKFFGIFSLKRLRSIMKV